MPRTKLFLAVEPEVTDNDHELADEGDPERRGRKWTAHEAVLKVPLCRVWEDAPRPYTIRCCRARDHDTYRTNNLCEGERGADVESRKGLEKDETETDALDRVKHT